MSAATKSLLTAIAAALAGCGTGTNEEDFAAANAGAQAAVEVVPPDESASTPTNDLATGVIDTPPRIGAPAPNPKTAIPSTMHGRWGLARADCAGESGVTKGLIAISAENIRFYNSVATPLRTHEISPRGIRAEFAFLGERGTWTGPMFWAVEGRTLVRIDSEADSRLVYTRC